MNFSGNNKPFGGFEMEDMNESGGFMIDGNDNSLQHNNERKQNTGGEQKLAPLKVGMILRSYSNFVTQSRFQLFDKDINLFKLVGFVRNVEQDDYPQRLRFYLDDGSGLILIDWLVDNTGTKYKQDLVNSIHEGCFVKIFGELTLMVSEPSVRAFVVRPLVCTDEISLHDIDVASYIVRSIYGGSNDSGKVQATNSNIMINKQGSMNFGNSGDPVKESNQNVVSSMFNLSGQFGNNNNNNNGVNSNNYGGSNYSNDQNVPMNKPPIKVVSAIAPKSNHFNSGAAIQNNPLKLREVISSILEQASSEGSPEMTIDGIFDSLITRDVHVTQEEIRNQLKNLVGEAKVYQTNPHTWRATGY
ncbi:replication protein [Cryptosporidium ubiquitum]|uniref:Replication protein n=1 Tax=Cryptosporidium ubiquitum TaxID=857276 RepID=A0A1J4MEX3_9CRYT|nr:replication protein [Cryptosporidium ubiquitum]OII71405.1 replication protein [Cryptosporidium ubiquitum]